MRTLSARLPPLALAYHGLAEVAARDDPYALFVAPRDFVRHVERLRAWGYRIVSFGELARLAAAGAAGGVAALTFDDGLADNVLTLLPLLQELAAPATVFVVSDWLGLQHPDAPGARILTIDELRLLQAGGVEIGGHTRSHADLATLGYAAAREELEAGRLAVEEAIGGPVDVAAYPFGHVNDETAAACRDAGFRAACRVSGEGSWDDPWNLPRQDMAHGSTMLGLRLKRDDRYEPLMRYLPVRALRRASRLAHR